MTKKCDTHRHLGGSVAVEWVWDTVNRLGLKHLAESIDDVTAAMTFADGEHKDFHRFLSKFTILNHIPWNEQLISGSIKSVCEGLEAEGTDYCWLDFSINKYMPYLKWHKYEAIEFISDCFETFRPGGVGLVLSLKYEAPRPSQKQYASLIDDPRVVDRLIGLDLVGDEEQFDSEFYKPIFKQWASAGKMLRAHVAESCGAENGLRAITDLHVTNIAHGLKMAIPDMQSLVMYAEMMEIARNRGDGITFDLGLTSNDLTGVWTDPDFHPVVTLLDSGQKVTLGTDDPIQCSTTLDKEFALARHYGVSDEQCEAMRQTAYDNCLKYSLI